MPYLWMVVPGVILLALAILMLDVADAMLRSWWSRHRDLPERIAERIAAQDIHPPEPARQVMAFADIVAQLPELSVLPRQIEELYLVPEVRDAD
jgi:small-conductance mechanosensitive channel